MTLSIQYLYYLVGAVLALTAIATFTDRSNPKRLSSGLFWGLYVSSSWWATSCPRCGWAWAPWPWR